MIRYIAQMYNIKMTYLVEVDEIMYRVDKRSGMSGRQNDYDSFGQMIDCVDCLSLKLELIYAEN